MTLLEAGLGWLERESLEEEDLAFRRAAVGDGEMEDDGSEGAARIRWRRLRGFLSGIRAFCEERGISCGADGGADAAATEETGRTAGVHPSASPGSRPSSAEHHHRFTSAQDTTAEDNDPSTWLSQSSNLSSQRTFCPDPRWVDESMLTSEQREVVDTEVDVGQTLTIVAYAGTGKTFTLRAVAQRNPTLKILYAAFNRSVAAAASSIFSSNTDCKTMSSVSLTGGTFGRVEGSTAKVTKAIQAFVGGNTRYSHAKVVLNSIDAFCASSDPDITSEHLKMPPLLSHSPSQSQSRTRRVERPSKGWVLATAKKVWGEMHPSPAAASSSTRGSRIPRTFSSCMKAYQLSEPDLSGRHAIYGFRGARDYLKKVKSFKTLYLTQVFRFPNPIASVANTVLLGLKRERRPLLGSLAFPDGPTKVVFERERHEWLQQDCESKGRFAYIARTNAGLMTEAVAAIGRGDRAAFMDGRAPNLQEVKDLCHMMMGEIGEVKNLDLKEIGSIPALREVLDKGTDDNDIKTIAPLLGMVDDYISAGKTPHRVLADMGAVESMRLGPDSKGPLMILTTVHKVKGLEYDTVVLADDFSFELVDGSSPLRKSATESANLLYVAVTRAKRQLILNKKLAHQLRSFGMWDSLALQGTTALCPAAGPVPCCTDGCDCADAHGVAPAADDPASVNGGAGGGAGSSQQRPRLLYGGSSSGGPLCRACAEGAGENSGAFPYFCSEFVSSSSESSAAAVA
ncbi:superfamily I DNA/RNA helicase-like protein [Ectocarpus siliculosus]|uniref:Superfamily I DNA/RNA helicase-like protein n=1 Tax=Ectocarpus siliculosus TaxID=2880 RepID=D7FLU8_ECTSI|nr:superfamily I DNA/RNA helicase-like protein [Ectocarpus siliculosus]|eukprot:CBJ29784.1 superfamily I DNA/RNA helicase-like protein [Ectocarpus siliculosus]